MLAAKKVKTDELEVGSTEKPSSIIVYDKNGKPGCLVIEDVETGAMRLVPGACGSMSTTSATPPPTDTSPTSVADTASSTPTADTTTSPTTETASTTPETATIQPAESTSGSSEESVLPPPSEEPFDESHGEPPAGEPVAEEEPINQPDGLLEESESASSTSATSTSP